MSLVCFDGWGHEAVRLRLVRMWDEMGLKKEGGKGGDVREGEGVSTIKYNSIFHIQKWSYDIKI